MSRRHGRAASLSISSRTARSRATRTISSTTSITAATSRARWSRRSPGRSPEAERAEAERRRLAPLTLLDAFEDAHVVRDGRAAHVEDAAELGALHLNVAGRAGE